MYLKTGEILQSDGSLGTFIVEKLTEFCYPFYGVVFMV